jgi:hypothetical protein
VGRGVERGVKQALHGRARWGMEWECGRGREQRDPAGAMRIWALPGVALRGVGRVQGHGGCRGWRVS